MSGYTDKELDGYTAEELEELEQMMALEEILEADKRETQAELDFYKQPHTDEEWKEHAKKEMLECGCPEEDLEKYFYYDSETHEYYHNEEGKKSRKWKETGRLFPWLSTTSPLLA